jgi:ubiquinone/menaquinone biosynthesis C-methylase UbiE
MMKELWNELRSIHDFYDSVYYRKTEKTYSKPSIHLRRLAARVGVHKQQRVLDVGCGLGQWLYAASSFGAIPFGIDLSDKAICVCRMAMPQGIFHAQAAEKLPFEHGFFDLVSCLGALEHFVDPKAALKEMVRVAKKDAQLLLLVPNADFPTLRLGLYSGTHQVAAKEEVRTLIAWTELFGTCGLEVKDRWRDLHVISWSWISSRGLLNIPLRAAQAIALATWPLKWQYQVYHLCVLHRPE